MPNRSAIPDYLTRFLSETAHLETREVAQLMGVTSSYVGLLRSGAKRPRKLSVERRDRVLAWLDRQVEGPPAGASEFARGVAAAREAMLAALEGVSAYGGAGAFQRAPSMPLIRAADPRDAARSRKSR